MKRPGIGGTLAAAFAIVALAGVAPLRAQGEGAEPPPRKSVYGTLDSIVESQRAVVMQSDDGERLVWRFRPEVMTAVREFEPGSEMIVIYRQTQPNQKTVTAIAFPGTATVPTYVNLTGSRVVLRSGPMVENSCDQANDVLSETPILEGGQAETQAACWCCAAEGEACTPSSQTGLGRALLVRCFR